MKQDDFAESAPDHSREEVNTGGQAFPSNQDISNEQSWIWMSGMTLRDYFAAKAMQGLCAFHGSMGSNGGPGSISERAYEIADFMIKER